VDQRLETIEHNVRGDVGAMVMSDSSCSLPVKSIPKRGKLPEHPLLWNREQPPGTLEDMAHALVCHWHIA
jgi:hypothetical protein